MNNPLTPPDKLVILIVGSSVVVFGIFALIKAFTER